MSIAEKLQQIADNEQNVFDAGYQKGKAEGGDSWYDTFWDSYQNEGVSGEKGTNGSRQSYQQAFVREGWNDNNFKPKYNMTPTTCTQMFQNCTITDLEKALQDAGVVLDTYNSTSHLQMIQSSTITVVPKIDMSNSTNVNYAFAVQAIKTIRELVISEKTALSSSVFASADNLEEVLFSGVIAVTLTMTYSSRLKAKSAKSAIDCLKNYKGTENEGVNYVYFHSDVWNRLNTEIPREDGLSWEDYVNSIGWST